jgi:hypothetical protein
MYRFDNIFAFPVRKTQYEGGSINLSNEQTPSGGNKMKSCVRRSLATAAYYCRRFK